MPASASDLEIRQSKLIHLNQVKVGDLGGFDLWRAEAVNNDYREAYFPGFNSISLGFRRNGDGYPVVITPKNGIW